MAEKLKFSKVEIPLLNESVEILAQTPKEAEGRTMKLDLTRHLKGKGVEAVFKLNAAGEKIIARIIRLHIFSFNIRRMMRKNIDYVEDSFKAESKNALMIIKPFLITRKKVHRSLKKALREKAREEIKEYIKDKESDKIFEDLLTGKLQKQLSLKLKKIYPLTFCDIRDVIVKKFL
jgi:ribosomal protein S3AE